MHQSVYSTTPASPYPYATPIPSFGIEPGCAGTKMGFEASCAICGAPAGIPECPHESERLTIALQQAQQRWLAGGTQLEKIKHWVLNHARAQILALFAQQKATRISQYSAYIASLPFYSLWVQYSGHPPLAPAALHMLQTQIAAADADLQRGIDADWRAAVMKYPEVLDHYYGLVEFRLPGEGDMAAGATPVKEKRKSKGRSGSGSVDEEDSPKMKRKEKGRAPPAVPMPGSYHGRVPGAFPSGASYFGGH